MVKAHSVFFTVSLTTSLFKEPRVLIIIKENIESHVVFEANYLTSTIYH